ncbi:MAG: hypothetical protein CMJ81_10420 [Planctomycetaceae bacterium]|nr:hypothetical protein [Planctomycetaceae bacterium]
MLLKAATALPPCLTTGPGILARNRHHILFIRQKQRHTLHVDETPVASVAGPGEAGSCNHFPPLFTGNEPTADRPWEGDVDSVTFFDRTLTADEAAPKGTVKGVWRADGPRTQAGRSPVSIVCSQRPDRFHFPGIQRPQHRLTAHCKNPHAGAVGPRRVDALGQVITAPVDEHLNDAAINEDPQFNGFSGRMADMAAL